MNTTTTTLPAPANGDVRYSIVTLAELLLVSPATVSDRLQPGDFHSIRLFSTYTGTNGLNLVDGWLEQYAAERIAAELHVGLLARRIRTVEDAARLDPDQVLDIVNHLVDQFGGAS
jgi:hypothetical protein